MSFLVDYISSFFPPAVDPELAERESHSLELPRDYSPHDVLMSGICLGTCVGVLKDPLWVDKSHYIDASKRAIQCFYTSHYFTKNGKFPDDEVLLPKVKQKRLGIHIHKPTHFEDAFDMLCSEYGFEAALPKISSIGRYI